MANEITITASLTGFKPSVMQSALGLSVTGLQVTMTGNFAMAGNILVGTSATIIPVGQITQPHYSFVVNKDSTNYIDFQNGAGGAPFARLYPLEIGLIPWIITAVPYAIANTAACELAFLFFSR
jgi:hypothetical protein